MKMKTIAISFRNKVSRSSVQTFECKHILWRSIRQIDVTTKTIIAFKWLFLVSNVFGGYISLSCSPLYIIFIDFLDNKIWKNYTNKFLRIYQDNNLNLTMYYTVRVANCCKHWFYLFFYTEMFSIYPVKCVFIQQNKKDENFFFNTQKNYIEL